MDERSRKKKVESCAKRNKQIDRRRIEDAAPSTTRSMLHNLKTLAPSEPIHKLWLSSKFFFNIFIAGNQSVINDDFIIRPFDQNVYTNSVFYANRKRNSFCSFIYLDTCSFKSFKLIHFVSCAATRKWREQHGNPVKLPPNLFFFMHSNPCV